MWGYLRIPSSRFLIKKICVKLIKNQKHPDVSNVLKVLGLAFQGFSKGLQKC